MPERDGNSNRVVIRKGESFKPTDGNPPFYGPGVVRVELFEGMVGLQCEDGIHREIEGIETIEEFMSLVTSG